MPIFDFTDHTADAFRYLMILERRMKDMSKYKVGDRVVLRKDLKFLDNFDGTVFVDQMEKYKTVPLTITKVVSEGLYETRGTKDDTTDWFVKDEMIAEKWNEIMNIGKALECMKLGMKIRDTSW